MADTAYQATATSGLRISSELGGLLHTQVPAEGIDVLNPNVTPFLAYMRHFKRTKTVEGITYVYHDIDEIKHRTALTATYASGGSTQSWKVTTGTGAYIPNHVLLLNLTRGTQGQLRSRSTDDLTVVPNVDSAGDAAGQIGDQIEVLASSLEEGTDVPSTVYTAPNEYTNYIQNMETPVSMTWHGAQQKGKSDYYGSPNHRRAWKQATRIHKIGKEKTLLLNGRAFTGAADTSAANPTPAGNIRSGTCGARGFMSQYADADHYMNETDITEFEWLDIVEKAQTKHIDTDGHKVAMVPLAFITGMTKWQLPKQRFFSEKQMSGSEGSEIVPGLKFSRYEIPGLTLDIVRQPHFEAATAGGKQHMFIFDPKRMKMTHFTGFDTSKYEDQYKTGKQVKIGFYFTAMGSLITQPNAHVWVTFNTIAA